jgi:inner membrane protein
MLNDILHHALAGALVALLFGTSRKYRIYGLLGGTAALLPDVSKELFSDLWLHSLVAAPIVSALYAGMVKAFFRNEPYLRLFGATLAAVVFGHLLLDLLDNGNAILYPFIGEELELALISKTTPLVWNTALAAIAAGLAFGKIRLLSAAGILAVLLFIGYQSVSKEMVTDALLERYPVHDAELVVYPIGEWPWEPVNWSWLLRSESFMAGGDAGAGGNIIQHHFYYTPPGEGPRYRVEEWTETGDSFVIRCFDEQSGRTVRFESEDGIRWRPAA